ncbi:hypothetical protein EAF04_009905 [Stromatinia cepivora]|nr:hypothetical protein EAF04_009905 [Stromatinia cepivora]
MALSLARFKFRKTRSKSATIVLPTHSNVSPPSDTKDSERTERFGLFHLNPIPTLSNGEEPLYRIDVVALHGIKGDAFKTWTEKREDNKKNFWLRDQLPVELPGARIFSYGYDANVLFSRGTGTIEDFARTLLVDLMRERKGDSNQKRRIIFICHSMGGIVLKKALITAVDNSTYRNIFDSTSAILFLATPHMGSDETKLPLSIANVANGILSLPMRFSGRVRDDLIMPLARDSSILREIQQTFKEKKLYEGLMIASFQEQVICTGLKGLVVDKESALLHIPNERAVPMNRDHRNICRFSGPESKSYQRVCGILKEYADKANMSVQPELTSNDKAVLSSIHYPDMEQRRHNTNGAYPGTCTWILRDPAYLRWKAAQRSLIWIKGKPGAGKSTLMAYILSNLRHHDSGQLVLNFFFHGRGSPLQKSPEGMYRELLHQLYLQASPIRESLRKSFIQKNDPGKSENDCVWTEDELKEWLFNSITCIAKSQPIMLYVDALDEAGDDNARMLIDYFDDMKKRVTADNGFLKICVSCRHYPNVSLSDGFEVNVENHNMRDIAVFVHVELVSRIRNWDNDRVAIEGREKMEAAIVKKSLGVFQWVKLVVPMAAETFNDTESLKDVHIMLEKVQDDLAAVYENILTNVIKVKYRSKTLLLMQWVALAERPLTATELRIAMACDEGSDNPGSKRWEDSEDYIESDRRMETLMRTLSGGLVEIALYTSGLYRVQFIHQTVVDFMLTEGLLFLVQHVVPQSLEPCEDEGHFSNSQILGQSQDRLSRSCVNYFKQPEVVQRNWTVETEKDETLDGVTYPLFKYAITNWLIHAEKAERLGFCQKHLVSQLEEPQGYFEIYVQYEYPVRLSSYCLQRGAVILHLMAFANLQGPARLLLERGDSIEDENLFGVRALHYATYHGHTEMVRLLLDAGADIGATQDGKYTPLEIAASRAHDDVLQLLIERGGDINAISSTGTALEGAAYSGDVRLVKKLLGIGARVDQEGRLDSTPLKAAARKGRVEVVLLLLSLGADVNHCKDYGTALQSAALAGHIEVCRALLQHGASVSKVPKGLAGIHATPLQCAANNNNITNSIWTDIELLRLLLEHGADINMQDRRHGTALADAVRVHGQVNDDKLDVDPRILFLLENGADTNAGCPLVLAASNGNLKLINLLLDCGAHINAWDETNGSALSAAAGSWKRSARLLDSVKLLLKRGADVNGYNNSGRYLHSGSALQQAAHWGDLEMVNLLLSHGANINLGTGQSGGALHEAAAKGHLEICRLFIDLGADLYAEREFAGSVLHAAASNNNMEIIRLLLSSGVHVDHEGEFHDGLGTTPLQAAAERGHLKAFNLLLAEGANIRHIGGIYHNMLQAAASGGSAEIVETCLKSGIDVNTKGGKLFETALLAAASEGHSEVVEVLLARGARDDTEGWWGSAWVKAAENGRRDVTKVLKEWGLERARKPSCTYKG